MASLDVSLPVPWRVSRNADVKDYVSFLRTTEKFASMVRVQVLNDKELRIREPCIISKLEAAYILRGGFVDLYANIGVRYDLLPEMSFYQVVTQENTRAWGSPRDFHDLSHKMNHCYPFGIILINHTLKAAFHFRYDGVPTLLTIKCALQHARHHEDRLVIAMLLEGSSKKKFCRVSVADLCITEVESTQWLRGYLVRCETTIPISQVNSCPTRSLDDSS
jgi:hypothetical protein